MSMHYAYVSSMEGVCICVCVGGWISLDVSGCYIDVSVGGCEGKLDVNVSTRVSALGLVRRYIVVSTRWTQLSTPSDALP